MAEIAIPRDTAQSRRKLTLSQCVPFHTVSPSEPHEEEEEEEVILKEHPSGQDRTFPHKHPCNYTVCRFCCPHRSPRDTKKAGSPTSAALCSVIESAV